MNKMHLFAGFVLSLVLASAAANAETKGGRGGSTSITNISPEVLRQRASQGFVPRIVSYPAVVASYVPISRESCEVGPGLANEWEATLKCAMAPTAQAVDLLHRFLAHYDCSVPDMPSYGPVGTIKNVKAYGLRFFQVAANDSVSYVSAVTNDAVVCAKNPSAEGIDTLKTNEELGIAFLGTADFCYERNCNISYSLVNGQQLFVGQVTP